MSKLIVLQNHGLIRNDKSRFCIK